MWNFHTVSSAVSLVGGALSIVASIWGIWLKSTGVLAVWSTIGAGLANPTIGIFAKGENFLSLKHLLKDSHLFKEKNITQIEMSDLKNSTDHNMYLVNWQDYQNELELIIKKKPSNVALIVYSPPEGPPMSPHTVQLVNLQKNAVVVNFRGRLLIDICSALITSSYDKGG